ncbi:hypothetical protein HSRCO_1912 [Halanaeroarchaeum sp. HSR-CO]|uniref:hypothetical protein n=1 Tax=Halanaeroarchaeum sp. HSR-CO TaxID=2866382 RepID=UPI00217DE491|nr:hypothetical protein [Halanaeroarchaeum sp. HSR-CO]UWG48191.1 hypothetical protein HSRCO_1912 [Halanaeroarchaeum sp. HSR-CO]
MTIEDSEKAQYRLDKDAYNLIKYEIVEETDLDSVADFVRIAVSQHAGNLAQEAKGGRLALSLTRRLSNIRGIEESVNQESADAITFRDNELEKSLTVNLSTKSLSKLGELQDETGLTLSEAIRACVYAQLGNMAESDDIRKDGDALEAVRAWSEVKTRLEEPINGFYHVLFKRFELQRAQTRYFIETDRGAFNDFAEMYKQDFIDSPGYEKIANHYGESTLNTVENFVGELTGYSTSSDSSFLEEYLTEG